MKKSLFTIVAVSAVAALALTGCSAGGSEGDGKTVKVAYQKFGNFTQLDAHMKEVKKTFEAENEGLTVELVPIEAQQNDYFTKLALMNQSAATALTATIVNSDFFIDSPVILAARTGVGAGSSGWCLNGTWSKWKGVFVGQ